MKVKIRIPATSANVGPGFDAVGLAVSLYNEVEMQEHDGVQIISADGADIPCDESNLVYSTAKQLYEICGVPFHGLKITQVSRIPFARGLGSSSACIIGGLKGANALLGNPMGEHELVDLAAAIEGHPDNTTPALTGGLITAVMDNGRVYYVKQEIQNDLNFVAIVPDFELHTSRARKVLPDMVPRTDAVFNLSRAALMSVSLYSGNYQNLRVAADDRLHQPYRLGLIHGAQQVMRACYDFGAYAVYISGAGSTLMAIVDAKKAEFSERISKSLPGMGLLGWRVHTLEIDNTGTVVEAV